MRVPSAVVLEENRRKSARTDHSRVLHHCHEVHATLLLPDVQGQKTVVGVVVGGDHDAVWAGDPVEPRGWHALDSAAQQMLDVVVCGAIPNHVIQHRLQGARPTQRELHPRMHQHRRDAFT